MKRKIYQYNTIGDEIDERVRGAKNELAKTYNVLTSSIVWMGGDKFIVVKDGKEIIVSA